MQSTRSLVKQLGKDYPEFVFSFADEFWWSSKQNTIFINPKASHGTEYTLHELSHALLDHRGYKHDIDLIKLERDAWAYATSKLAPTYNVKISEDTVQDNLDTYREWLYARSTCPDCHTTGLETKEQLYHCFACGHEWQVNEARLCALRRHSLQTK